MQVYANNMQEICRHSSRLWAGRSTDICIKCSGKRRPLYPAAATLVCSGRFIPVSTAAWCLRPVGLRYASDHFRGRPHRQVVAEP